MKKEVFRSRIREILKTLRAKRIRCLVVTQKANVSYCTGFLGDDMCGDLNLFGQYMLRS
ncbi:MAG: aminopeptidase P family N-terminal domain-containing protein [Planctomycetota bacterium]